MLGWLRRRRQARFPQQTLPVLFPQIGPVDDLDGDVPVEQLVAGAVDHRHSAAAELGLQAVALLEQGTGFHIQAGEANRSARRAEGRPSVRPW